METSTETKDVPKETVKESASESKSSQAVKPLSAIAHRMFHPPKLERKHSSGDLHSRLKTRKILGVGETDNGDIHRSKISQLLGHNEHLYVKFPRGYGFWHLAMAVTFTFLGINNLFFPENSYDLPLRPESIEAGTHEDLACRFYGCTSLAVAFLLWTFWGTMDKGVARTMLLAVALCHTLQIIALILSQWGQLLNWYTMSYLLIRALLVIPNAYFYRSIGFCGLRMRKSNSFSNLRDCISNNNGHSKKSE